MPYYFSEKNTDIFLSSFQRNANFLGKNLINYLSLFRLFGLNQALLITKHYRFNKISMVKQ
jgi:hypothetical protein